MLFEAVAIYVFISKEKEINRAEEILFYHLNLGFLLLIFSKERNKDELFNQIRLKAIVASLVGIITFCWGLVAPSLFVIEEPSHEWVSSFGVLIVFFDVFYLGYIYYTKFRMRR